MNSSYLNMGAGALLAAVFVVMTISIVSEAIYYSEAPEQQGFAIEVAEAEGGDGEAAPAEPETPFATLLASADAAAGERGFAKCSACHSIEEGGPNRVGPNLWDTVGRPIASVEGFSYSAALQEFAEGGAVVWDYEHLDGFLENPKDYVPGTAMSFAGIRDDEDRADMVAYMRSMSADPPPLPEPPAEDGAPEAEDGTAQDSAAEDGTTAEGETAAADAGDQPAATDSDAAAEETAQVDTAADEAAQAADDAAGDEAAADEVAGDGEQPAAEEEAAAGDEAATSDDAAASDEVAAGEDGAAAEDEATADASAFVSRVAAADPAVGERGFAQCRACHTIEEGGGRRVGPNLWGVVGRPVASVEGFNYSPAMQEFAEGGEVVWDYEHLDGFLADPQGYVPGTLMGFAGIDDIEDRAAMVAYLRSMAGEPAPLAGGENSDTAN